MLTQRAVRTRRNTNWYSRGFVAAIGCACSLASCFVFARPYQQTTSQLSGSAKEQSGAVDESPVSYVRDIRPILVARCYACHGPDEATREGSLGLHRRDLSVTELDSGAPGIVPRDAKASEVVRRISAPDEYDRMPPPETGDALSANEIHKISLWIEQGATFDLHWSYRPVARPESPDVAGDDWIASPIDGFVLARLESMGLAPAPPASRETLIRRLSLDLLGLPPTPEQVTAFVTDDRAGAYERLVDQLLDSPRYGEHWARLWLDLARYADSQGYAQDELRTIWPYRDWVIRAFNQDMPFDQFTIEQLAGDLLPNPTTDQLTATGFHRNTMTNTEGGTDDEEFRHAAVIDRINTTAQVWMGTTLGCAQCHTHKYDPISHQEYYQFFAIFNQTADNDQPDNRPTIPVVDESFRQRMSAIEAQISSLVALRSEDPDEVSAAEQKLAGLKKALNELQMTRTPVMRELPDQKRRQTHVALRGAFNNPGEMVTAGLPAAFYDQGGRPVDRLELAKWLVSPQHPLTARVAVNRHWEQFFGTGIVETSEDFGSQGALPTHPELLDYLAAEFVSGQFSMKGLCKAIVMSNTYRQSSVTTKAKTSADPLNRYFSRGPRHRLTAEQTRDYALAVSGLLSEKMYGPPVRPPQPKSGLSAAFGGSLDWEASAGEDRYRRGIYTLWRRTNPYPSFLAMDATDRKTCTVRRVRTNTPVAVFVTLNDPAFVEAAQRLAKWIESTADRDLNQQIADLFARVVCRLPSPAESDELQRLYESTREHYEADRDAALLLSGASGQPTQPELAETSEVDVASLSAWTVVSNILLNLDETLTKN